jgi:hypothetical protein
LASCEVEGMVNVSWLQERNHFQHDWLSHFLVDLGSLAKVLDDSVEYPEFEERFFRDVLPQWPERRRDALRLAESYESEMSPRIYFDEEPLCRLPDLRRPDVIELIHGLWVGRVQPAAIAARVRSAVWQVDRGHFELTAAKCTSKRGEMLAALGALQDACLALHHTMREFPVTTSLL